MLQRAASHIRRLFAPSDGPIILTYHRVGSPGCDLPELAVSVENFAEQIHAIKRSCTVVPLTWLAQRLLAGKDVRRTAVITFDDGYADVLQNARPILDAHDCPATLFVATGYVGAKRPFWWDAIALALSHGDGARLIASGASPSRLGLSPTDRALMREFRKLATLFRAMSPEMRDAIIARLQPAPRDIDRTMTAEELIDWRRAGMFDVGAHSVRHPSLPHLPFFAQAREIADSRVDCANYVGEDAGAFAYPYGDYNRETMRAAWESGVRIGCTTEQRRVSRGEHPLRLPRFYVGDWSGEMLEKRLALAQ